eukprot:TRINITY_DN1066_c0_g1_i2.p2 TRINITY_DN1066_c0_g1~~TRINITY_DN1066_c0_g1_i2.p2  ORF type:complete len:452 (+),score=49.54 TRINITY_DN1066_c0_g1_i2:209-1564(+)
MSFFIPDRKRKRQDDPVKSSKKQKKKEEEDSLDSDAIPSDDERSPDDSQSADAEDAETADEKRIRYARQYLTRLRQTASGDSEQDDEEAVETRIRSDTWESTAAGRKGFRPLAEQLIAASVDPSKLSIVRVKGHQLPVTAVRISEDEKFVYSASKDCSIVKWEVPTGKKIATYKGGRNKPELGGHTDQILALALSSDGKYLASGGMDKQIRVWDTELDKCVDTFTKHKDAVSGLAFRIGSHELYSCGFDRRLTLWSCDEMTYIDTLYGHEANITCIDVLTREIAVTGSEDKDLRVWKIVDQQCLVYKGPKSSVDCVAMVNEDHFVSGGQDGSIQIWYSGKRRPECIIPEAHGPATDGTVPWISSIAAARYSDLIASGSSTGEIKLWKIDAGWRSAREILKIPMAGFINSLQFSRSASYLIVGVGQEHRFGRWSRIKQAKNSVCIIPLPIKR